MSTSDQTTLLMHHKQRFLATLHNLLAPNALSRAHAGLFFHSLFDFCRLSADAHAPIAQQFTPDEKQALASDLRRGLPTINAALKMVHRGLDASVVQQLKKVRSSVQYLADDFAFLDEFDGKEERKVSEVLQEIVKWDRVELIDEDLPNWDEPGAGEFYVPVDVLDLSNVPRSHSWWTDDDRAPKKN